MTNYLLIASIFAAATRKVVTQRLLLCRLLMTCAEAEDILGVRRSSSNYSNHGTTTTNKSRMSRPVPAAPRSCDADVVSRKEDKVIFAPPALSAAADAIEGDVSAIVSDRDRDRDSDRKQQQQQQQQQEAQVPVVGSDGVAMSVPEPVPVPVSGGIGWGCHTIMMQHCARMEARNVAARRY